MTVTTNEDQIAYWNGKAGRTWVRRQADLDGLIGGLGERLIDAAELAPGDRVLDVGCGSGHTTALVAERVAPNGSVVGIDISRVMLEAAARRAVPRGVEVELRLGDAQVADLGSGSFDAAVSRLGVMFFSHPESAFANIASSLIEGGRFCFLCWQAVQANAWILEPLSALARHIELPSPPPPGAPGPFSLADADRIQALLEHAGWADISIQDLRQPLSIGRGSVDSALDFMLQIGPASRALSEAEGGDKEAAVAELRTTLQRFAVDGVVTMSSAAWLVSARRR